ncbi:YwmB family TATA-box binding protein [Priestia endophytica]|uniref:YwmB family TATA-box binding protein n=1 Tax=Priestia endophytica TaxID=135735 RepID=UPI000F52F4B2|nr:YwmB family TATA-box binding protein [Priestia endophytica]RPK08963.1 hypothetical protein FH5_04764 [Priestia endophytica]
MLKFKNSVFLAIFILAIFLYHGNYVSFAFGEKYPIEELAHGVHKSEGTITEWSIYNREQIDVTTKAAFESKVALLKKKYAHFQWSIQKDKEVWKAVGVEKEKKYGINEKIQLLMTLKKEHHQSYIIYDVKGKQWSQEVWSYFNPYLTKKNEELFTGNFESFACIRGHFNDNIKGVLSLGSQKLLKAFKADSVEELSEEAFVSVTAYTEMWEDVLLTQDQQRMNLQIAIRNQGMGEKTTFVVGTPIITSEY